MRCMECLIERLLCAAGRIRKSKRGVKSKGGDRLRKEWGASIMQACM